MLVLRYGIRVEVFSVSVHVYMYYGTITGSRGDFEGRVCPAVVMVCVVHTFKYRQSSLITKFLESA